MVTESLSEIVNQASNISSKAERVEFLKKNNSRPLRNVLKLMYDKTLKFNIPNSAPPYTPSESSESHGMLFREARKLVYFVEGFGGDNMSQMRRESLFIQMLETVDKDDAELLIRMLTRKPYKGITVAVLNEAFGPTFIPKN